MRNLPHVVDSRHPAITIHATHGSAASDWLHLAAAPTFTVMALLTALTGVPEGMLCGAGHGMSLLGGMTLMYVLMALVHAGPWLNLLQVSWRKYR